MNWEDLEQKHQEQWTKFEELKQADWDRINTMRKQMYAAFGDHEAKIPMSVHEKVERERREWQNAWGDHGYKAKYLLAIQKKERDTLKEYVRSNALAKMRQARDEKTKSKTYDRERGD